MSKTCAILQPTFLPWLGWFDIADQVDVLVILDDVSFSKQSWQQRNRIRTPAGLELLTVPVKTSGRLGQRIGDCELANQTFVIKMLKSIQANYAKSPFFAQAHAEFATTMEAAALTGRLVDLNFGLIDWMARRLEVVTPSIRASALNAGGERGEHVAAICEAVGADRYLSPAGSEDYLVEDKLSFERRGISVWLHAYGHPEYVQRFSPFISHASAIDLIFNAGPSAPSVMRSGRRAPRPLTSAARLEDTAGAG